MLKRIVKKFLPKPVLSTYHYCLARIAAIAYGHPANKMIVIGITGTSGKTTTSYLTAQLLELAGFKTGLSSTALFKVADQEWLNNKKMTMLGRFQTQKLLKQMVKAGCQYAVVETSSEGILQSRQVGIHYDVLVFTNLTPEHLEAHGGFNNYKNTKLKLFQIFARTPNKILNGKKIEKIIVANLDNEHSADFLNFKVDQKITFSLDAAKQPTVLATDIETGSDGLNFKINGEGFSSSLLGKFNVYNNLAAISVLTSQRTSLNELEKLLSKTKPCPGRVELINEGQPFTIVVDFAFEPNAMANLYQTIVELKHPTKKIIHVLGGTGGGRDKSRRPKIGALAGRLADVVIVTNEDPYDEDPQDIINQVAAGALSAGKIEHENLFKILDRRQAINKALKLAQSDDIVLVTGKGSEQAIVGENGQMIPWDDRKVVREGLKLIKN